MSLVERAAKRLAELEKAGVQGAGELAYPPSHDQTAPNLIERAARRTLEGPTGDRPDSEGYAPASLAQDATTRKSAAAGESLRPKTAHNPRRVQLDFSKFISAGYLLQEDSESEYANEFRKIKRPLIKACQGKASAPVENANRIMVTSSVPGEGKSFVAFNLARSIALERDSTVLLIDADTTRPKLSQLAGLESSVGLLDLLVGGTAEISDALFRTNIDRLTLLPAGTSRRHATELLASTAMERLVEHLASRYPDRILIFDAPPLLGAPEPAVLAGHMGQIIVVVEADKTMHKVLTKALTTIQSCPVVTTVLNKASSTEQGYFYAG